MNLAQLTSLKEQDIAPIDTNKELIHIIAYFLYDLKNLPETALHKT